MPKSKNSDKPVVTNLLPAGPEQMADSKSLDIRRLAANQPISMLCGEPEGRAVLRLSRKFYDPSDIRVFR